MCVVLEIQREEVCVGCGVSIIRQESHRIFPYTRVSYVGMYDNIYFIFRNVSLLFVPCMCVSPADTL